MMTIMKLVAFVGRKLSFSMISLSLPFHNEIDLLGWGSFIAGFTHPVLGLDHLLAMLSVGIISAQIGGNAIWTVPTTFVGVMAVGGGLGLLFVPLLPVEVGIALSVLILGGVIMLNWTLPVPIAIFAVAVFAIFHGYAHGVEMPEMSVPWRYATGFLTSTAIIHILGVLVGQFPTRYEYSNITFGIIGFILTIFGLLFMFGIW